MTREHSPKPGVTWQQQPTTREVVVPDGPWGGPTTLRFWGIEAEPAPPRPNRRARRDAKRAARKANR